jgi:osmotically inducible protein OsmC
MAFGYHGHPSGGDRQAHRRVGLGIKADCHTGRDPHAFVDDRPVEPGMPTDVDLLMAPFRDALSERPFGTAAGVRDAADPRRQIGAAIAVLAAEPRDEGLAAAERETAAALARAGGTSGDFESARQIGWVLAPLLDGLLAKGFRFQTLAGNAKAGCPVSRLLKAEISLEATLA